MKVSLPETSMWSRGAIKPPRVLPRICKGLVLLLLLTASAAMAQDEAPKFVPEMTIIFDRLGAVEIDCPVEMSPTLYNPRCALFAPGDDYVLFRSSFDIAMREAFGDRFEAVTPWQLQGGSYLKGFNEVESPFVLLVAFATNDTGFMVLAGSIQ